MKRLLLFAIFAGAALAQQTALSPWFPEQFSTTTGAAAAGYKVCSYQAGTSTPLATFTDATGATANTNPVILDSTGYGSIWLGSAAYKLVLMTPGTDNTCSTGSAVRTVDQVTVNVPRWISAQAYGAKCDGSTDDTTAISSAIAAAVTAGQPLIVQGASPCITGAQTLSSAVQIKGPGTLKRKTGVTSALLTVSASGVQLDSITLDCNSQGTNGGNCLTVSSVAQFLMANSTVKNTVAGEYALRCSACTNSEIRSNTFTAIKGPGIAPVDGSQHLRISSNTIDNTTATNAALAGSPISVENIGSGGNIFDVTVNGNTVTAALGFCVEAGVFGGSGTVSLLTVTGNTCTIVNSSGSASCRSASSAKSCGGYSLAAISNSSIVGNTFNAAGQTVDIGGIEVGCTGCTVSGNDLLGAVDTALNGNAGIVAYCKQCVIGNNQITNWGSVSTAGILLQAVSGFPNIDDNTVTGNTIVFPTSGSSRTGIYVNCNVNSGSAQRNVITGNKLIGNSTTGTGVTLAVNGSPCPVDSTVDVANQFYNLAIGTLLGGGPTNVMWLSNTHATVTSALQNNGGLGTFIGINTLGFLKVNSQSTPAQALDVSGNALVSGYIVPGLFTVAGLPACSGAIVGAMATVSDQMTNNWGDVASGLGSDNVLMVCDASNWRVFAK